MDLFIHKTNRLTHLLYLKSKQKLDHIMHMIILVNTLHQTQVYIHTAPRATVALTKHKVYNPHAMYDIMKGLSLF